MTAPAIQLRGGSLRFGERELWSGLDLDVAGGELLAVLGPNGSGKTTLLRVLLGTQTLTAGSVSVLGRPPSNARLDVAYVPQQRAFDPSTPLRGRDLVRFGVDGHRWGTGLPWSPRAKEGRSRVNAALDAVGAAGYARARLGRLSGGEQQRLRIAQALAARARLMLCDEPLLSLDLRHQQQVVELIAGSRAKHDTAVVFVTHEINPLLQHVDRVLYIVNGRFRVGPVSEVMTSETLSELYGTDVDVIEARGRLVVVTGSEADQTHHHDNHLGTSS